MRTDSNVRGRPSHTGHRQWRCKGAIATGVMSKQLITQNSNATGANSKNILHIWISELKNEDIWSKWAVLTHPLLACNGPSPSEYIILLNPGPYYKHWAVNARLRKKKLHNLRPKVLGLQIPGIFFNSAGATLIHGGIAGISRGRWNIKLSAAHHWLKLFFFQCRRKRFVQPAGWHLN